METYCSICSYFITYRLYLFWQTWTFSHQIEEMLPSFQRDKATFDTIHAKLCRSLVYRERSDVFGKPDHVVGMLFVGIQRLQAKSSPEKLFPSPLCQDLDCPGTIPGSSTKTPTSILVFNVKRMWQDWGFFLTIRSTWSETKGPNRHAAEKMFMCWWECPTNAHKQMYRMWCISPLQPFNFGLFFFNYILFKAQG